MPYENKTNYTRRQLQNAMDGNQTIEVAEKILTKGTLTYIRRLAQHNQQF